MGFWSGYRKVIEGLEEIVESPTGIAKNIRARRREKLSGKYVVTIPDYGDPPKVFVAHIIYNGTENTHDIVRIAYKGGATVEWDDLSFSDKNTVGWKINTFLNLMLEKKGASPYD